MAAQHILAVLFAFSLAVISFTLRVDAEDKTPIDQSAGLSAASSMAAGESK